MWLPSPSYLPEKEIILGERDNKMAATSMWTKLGFTITRATTSTMTKPIFFFFLFYHFLGNAPSAAYSLQYWESGDISENLLVHQPIIWTVPSGKLPGNRVANGFDITMHHQIC